MEKKNKKVFFGILVGIFTIILGFFIIRGILERTIETETGVGVLESEATEANLEFLRVKLLSKILLEFKFRALENEELLEEISGLEGEVKGALERINGVLERGEALEREDYKLSRIFKGELEEIMTEIGEAREVLRKEFNDVGDRQLEFIEAIAKYSEEEKVGVFISRTAFSKETGDLGELGVVLVNGGRVLVESGEEKVNVFFGGEEGVGLTTEDIEGVLKRGEGEVFSLDLETGKMMRIGENLEKLTRKGRLTAFLGEFSGGKLRKVEISLRGKGTWDLKEELEARGIRGLVGENLVENNIPETLMKIYEEL